MTSKPRTNYPKECYQIPPYVEDIFVGNFILTGKRDNENISKKISKS
jgi:hypothetical protein